MLTKEVTYTDLNGLECKEKVYFNLTEAELNEMQLEEAGGLGERMQVIADKKDIPAMLKVFKEIILRSYGEKSADGKRFVKTKTVVTDSGVPVKIRLADEFVETEAYSQIYMELLGDADAASAFFLGVVPPKFADAIKDKLAEQKAEQ